MQSNTQTERQRAGLYNTNEVARLCGMSQYELIRFGKRGMIPRPSQRHKDSTSRLYFTEDDVSQICEWVKTYRKLRAGLRNLGFDR